MHIGQFLGSFDSRPLQVLALGRFLRTFDSSPNANDILQGPNPSDFNFSGVSNIILIHDIFYELYTVYIYSWMCMYIYLYIYIFI